jgi:hypothetical protein
VAYEAAQALALRQGARLWQRRAAEALAGLRPGRASGDATNAAVPDGATARRLA